MLCLFRKFLFNFFFFPGREYIVQLSKFSQEMTRFKAKLVMICLLFAPTKYPGLFTGAFYLDL